MSGARFRRLVAEAEVSLPFPPPILDAAPPVRVARPPADPPSLEGPRRSAQLAAKTRFRVADPVAQAQKVIIDKLGGATPQDPLDVSSFPQYQFAQPWTGSKFEEARELFPAGAQVGNGPLAFATP
ncbi:hypothetical protein C2845_PM09G09690 [Panicum miliaceum]|uniref:Uncharacterized protein n=1 Tax=Panicum miliaceum TaxID=4540 RepID=A0A3L6RY70_PANMI|nr:hypothetical protein C2845_PM09G09690 [Panicum miliaceum]